MNTYTYYHQCIDASLKAAMASNNCAKACSKTSNSDLYAECIRLTIECSTICHNAARLIGMGSSRMREICSICAFMCEQCAYECSKYDNAYCNKCAEACRACVEECRKLASMDMAA